MCRQGYRGMRYDASVRLLLGAEFHPPYLPQRLTAARGRLSSLMQSLSLTIGKSGIARVPNSLTLLIKRANSKATDRSNRGNETVLSSATRDFEHSNLEW